MTLRNNIRLAMEGRGKGFGFRLLTFLLKILSGLYGWIVAVRKKLYDLGILKSKKLPIPVVSVGNVTWGGTGKTPVVMYLTRFFLSEQKRPLILTRGYGMDEVREYSTGVPKALVGVGKHRAKVAADLLKSRPADIAILDDGFQHWQIRRDLDLVVINALNPFGTERLIPAGILREKLSSLKRADVILFNDVNLMSRKTFDEIRSRVRALAPKAELAEAYREPLYFYGAAKKDRLDPGRLKGKRVTTFSGIGMPRSFQLLITSMGLKAVRNFEFCDHHDFTEKELREIAEVKESSQSEYVVTTEKDFLRKEKMIAQFLNPLVLRTGLRIISGDGMLKDRLRKVLSV